MLEVGTGVGYLYAPLPVACLFTGLGRPGEEDKGSKAGSKDAGRLTPEIVGSVGSSTLLLLGEESI